MRHSPGRLTGSPLFVIRLEALKEAEEALKDAVISIYDSMPVEEFDIAVEVVAQAADPESVQLGESHSAKDATATPDGIGKQLPLLLAHACIKKEICLWDTQL